MIEKRTHDIQIRLGDKKHIKKELEKIAKKNGLTLQQIVIIALERLIFEYGKDKKAIQIVLK